MPSAFPAGTDSFTEPSSPSSTALSSPGTGSKNHVQHHRDLGDAIEAMQAEATLLVHSHDGSTARHGEKLDQVNTHESADTDVGASSIHHTLGVGANQAAPGNHSSLPEFSGTHAGAVAWPVGSVFMTTVAGNPSGSPHDLGGTWVQITDAFLVGVGGSFTFTGSVVDNTTTHTHTTAATSTGGSHSHTIATPTDTYAVHAHDVGNTGSKTPSHTHTGSSSTGSGTHSASTTGTGFSGLLPHTHTLSNSGGTSHLHSGGKIQNNSAGHSHTLGSSSSDGSHSHTTTPSTVAHLPPWLAVYMWKRTA